MPKIIPVLFGSKYKRWTVLKDAGIDEKSRQKIYLCRCDCGHEQAMLSANLRSKKNCQCCLHCTRKEAILKSTKHGLEGSRIYSIWRSMKQRCLNSKDISYRYYGERNIKFCKRWDDFINFFEDMGHAPEGMQLDRINPEGDYEKSNCRWVTRKENMQNRRCSMKNKDKYLHILKSDLCGCCLARVMDKIDKKRRGL